MSLQPVLSMVHNYYHNSVFVPVAAAARWLRQKQTTTDVATLHACPYVDHSRLYTSREHTTCGY